MHKTCVSGIAIVGLILALSGQASTNGMALAERVRVADFIGVIHIHSVHPSRDAGKPEEQRQDWFVQTADAVVTETIKGVNMPSHITIQFDHGHAQASPNVLYDADADYLVFLAFEVDGSYSTCVQGQYSIHGSTIRDWPGSTDPITLEAARNSIAKLLPR